MNTTRSRVAAVVSLVGGSLAILTQSLVTPLSGGTLDGADIVAKATAHHTAMGWALTFDVLILLAAPAFLYLGALAGARTSRLAALATATLFVPFLMSCPPVIGLDALGFFSANEPDRAAMAHLVDTWQNSLWFAVGVVPYVVLQIVGSVMLAIALRRSGAVPTWTVIATAVWPVLGVVGFESGSRPVVVVAYALLCATWTTCALALVRAPRRVPSDRPMVTA